MGFCWYNSCNYLFSPFLPFFSSHWNELSLKLILKVEAHDLPCTNSTVPCRSRGRTVSGRGTNRESAERSLGYSFESDTILICCWNSPYSVRFFNHEIVLWLKQNGPRRVHTQGKWLAGESGVDNWRKSDHRSVQWTRGASVRRPISTQIQFAQHSGIDWF